MGKVNFILSSKLNKAGEALILLDSYIQRERLRLSTGEVISPANWNKGKQEAKRSHPNYSTLNAFLSSLRSKLNEIELTFKANGKEYNAKTLKAQLSEIITPKPQSPQPKQGLFVHLDKYIEVQSELKASNTLKKFHTLRLHLANFSEQSGIEFISENLNFSFYEAFLSYCVKQGLNNTSSGKYIAALKTFLLWGMDSELIPPIRLNKWKVSDSPNEVIALTKAEVYTLWELDLSHNERLSKVRDLFVFSCVTGLRFSDCLNISKHNVHGDFIKVKAIKTGKADNSFLIPLNQISKAILAKHNNALPKLSNQKANVYLKELCKLAGLTRPAQKVAYFGAKRKETNSPLHEMVSFHSARKTYITVHLSEGVNRESVKQTANIHNWKVMERYIANDPEQARRELSGVWVLPLKAI